MAVESITRGDSFSTSRVDMLTRNTGNKLETGQTPNEYENDLSREDMKNRKIDLPSLDDVHEAIENLNKTLQNSNRRLEYSVHEGTDAIMVKVVNMETDEVIREIPPEKILDLVEKIWDMAGIIVDERI